MKILDFLKKYKNIILNVFYVLVFLTYIVKPINFDTKIYLSAAYQADLIGIFPENLFQAWEHKLILNRLIFYLLFKITNLFVNVNNIIIFETIVKFIYGIISILIIKLFSKQTKEFFEKYKITEKIVFFCLYMILMASRNLFYYANRNYSFAYFINSNYFRIKRKKNI